MGHVEQAIVIKEISRVSPSVGQLGMLLTSADLDHLAGLDLVDAGLQDILGKILGQILDHLLVFIQ